MAHEQRRIRRTQTDLRERLIEAALIEFAAHGFEGASTRSIANYIGAHQPQINYHFDSKEDLWKSSLADLFDLSSKEVGRAVINDDVSDEVSAEKFADQIRAFIDFAARHPELNRIMVHESTSPGPRLEWLVENFVGPLYTGLKPLWERLQRAGIAAPIHPVLIHHALMGATTLLFLNAHELELLEGIDATKRTWIDRHADGMIATFLPGLRK
jgi:TetR/AcrR family transcriptional regulator